MRINEIKFRLPLVKITAIFLSFSLILSESSLYALPLPSKPLTVSIPGELGTIEETFQAACPKLQASDPRSRQGKFSDLQPAACSRKVVIYIQDAHDSLEAQENIAKTIQYLVKRYGVRTVYEEGYEGLVPTDDYFGFIKDPAIKEKVSYFLMDKLRIGGAEYAHINRHNPVLRDESWAVSKDAYSQLKTHDRILTLLVRTISAFILKILPDIGRAQFIKRKRQKI